jgi:hypothetical protein
VQRAETGTSREQITLTVDEDALPATRPLAHRLRDLGFTVAQQTFVRTGLEEERRAVLLLTLHRPLEEVVDLVTPPASPVPDAVWPALMGTLQALERNQGPAVLQIKAEETFVSLVAQDLADVERAVRLLVPLAAHVRRWAAREPRGTTECRLVYSGGSWTIYGQWPDETLVYDAVAGQLRSARAR